MATIAYVVEDVAARGDNAHIITWTPLVLNDIGQTLEMTGSSKRSVQVIGVFGGGASILIEGSNNGSDFSTLKDEFGNALNFKGAGLASVSVLSRFIRPRVPGGAAVSATIVLLVRKENRR